ncbi:B12-binding domain-containing radical SAM protein [Candidatus Woesearchaeota archaeon]|nr:B12-binding domain-containing radical SAM protein [Candidatus Woesearchaeota archaeon]
MPKNILLVYPKIPNNTYWSFHNSLKFIGKKSSMPPLGLLTVAGMLDDYNLKLVDENVQRLKDKHLQWADMVFTSSIVVQSDSLDTVVARAKKMGKPVVAGGPYPTQFYDKIKGVDHFILGEAESGVLEQFLDDFEHGRAKRAYARFSVRTNTKGNAIDMSEFYRAKNYFVNDCDIELAEARPEMDHSPIPKFDLLDFKAYGSMAVQFSRGCPYQCEFCSEPALFGNKTRMKSAERFVKELSMLYDQGYKGAVFVVDDNFIGNVNKVKEVLPAIEDFQKERNYPFSFFTEASLNLSRDEELMRSMNKAGFNMVFVGIESTDEEALRCASKNINVGADLLGSVRKIQKNGMEVTAGIIVGLDKEPEGICDKIFAFCQNAGIPTAMAGLLTPVLGSELYERLKREKRLIEARIKGNNTHNFDLDYVPDRGRDPSKIISSYKDLLAKLYDRNGKNYFERCRQFLDNIVPSDNFVRKVTLTEIVALTRSIVQQGFSSHGPSYFRFLWYALRKKRKAFPEAVRLAITGHHLMKITKEALKNAV